MCIRVYIIACVISGDNVRTMLKVIHDAQGTLLMQENQILLYIEKFINVLLMLHILVIEVSIYHLNNSFHLMQIFLKIL